MRRIGLWAFALVFLSPLLASAPAHAQASRTWVSGVGDDLNPCSRTAPCKTFAGAISKTAAGGQINCLDSGGYGAVTITKSMTIQCQGVIAGILAAGTTGVIVNALATDNVMLKGIDIDGGPPGVPGVNGIRILSAGVVHVEDCVIHNFRAVAPNGFGIKVDSTSSPTFVVSRTSFFNNANAAIMVRPTTATATGTIDRVIANRNTNGVQADTSLGATAINLTVKDSSFNGNTGSAISAAAAAGAVGIMVNRSSLVSNGTGMSTTGAGATIRVGDSMMTGNTTVGTGTVLSYGNNQSDGNGNNGTLTLIPAPALK